MLTGSGCLHLHHHRAGGEAQILKRGNSPGALHNKTRTGGTDIKGGHIFSSHLLCPLGTGDNSPRVVNYLSAEVLADTPPHPTNPCPAPCFPLLSLSPSLCSTAPASTQPLSHDPGAETNPDPKQKHCFPRVDGSRSLALPASWKTSTLSPVSG